MVDNAEFLEVLAKAHCNLSCPEMDWKSMTLKQKYQHLQPADWWLSLITGAGLKLSKE